MLPQIFPQAVHHECIFHAVQNARNQMTKVYGRNYRELRPDTIPLHEAITELFHAQTQKTVRKRYAELMAMRSTYVAKTPEIACVFDSLERHFPKLVNAIESPDIPRTNNATELVIRRFDQHYQSSCAGSIALNPLRCTCGCSNSSIVSRRSWTTTRAPKRASARWNWPATI